MLATSSVQACNINCNINALIISRDHDFRKKKKEYGTSRMNVRLWELRGKEYARITYRLN